MKKILFVFDQVAHYHRELFTQLDARLSERGAELHLLSGIAHAGRTGRVGVAHRVVARESKYRFHELAVGSYVFRTSTGVLPMVRAIKPDVVVCMGHVGDATAGAGTLQPLTGLPICCVRSLRRSYQLVQ